MTPQIYLLGLPAIIALNLATRIDIITDYESLLINSSPGLFSGLGNLGEPYEMKLKADEKPHANYAPRSIPLPIGSKVLGRTKQDGISWSHLKSQATNTWCAGMVAVPKKFGALAYV